MAYEIESWTRCAGTMGEELHRKYRIRNLEAGKAALNEALKDRSICRVTMSRTGSVHIWDLWRSVDRDIELDASMRDLSDLRGREEGVRIEAGPGITADQLAAATRDFLKGSTA